MFSRLKKSFQGSPDTLQTRHTENRSLHDVRDLLDDFEQKSMISTCQSEILERGRKRKKERKSRLRNIFRPNEEETSSLVSADPWPHNRSVSLQVLTDHGRMPNSIQKGKEFHKVEASMQNIQKSLSISALPQTFVNHKTKDLKETDKKTRNRKKDDSMMKTLINMPAPQQSDNNNGFVHPNKSKKSVIDLEITSAELEFEVEKYKLEIMNLKQNMKAPKVERLLKEKKEETLFKKIATSAVLISKELSRYQLKSVDIKSEGVGLELRDDCGFGHLTVYDTVLELNSLDVFRITKIGWKELKTKLIFPVKAVFMKHERREHKSLPREGKTMPDLRSDISHIQSRLEKKLLEGKKTCTELELVVKERNSLGKENLRLMHRIAFLEDHTKELQMGLKQIQSSLEKTLKIEVSGTLSNLGSLRPLPRDALASMSDDRCSTATSGIYSNTGSDSSNLSEMTNNCALSKKGQTFEERKLNLQNIRTKSEEYRNPNCKTKGSSGQTHVSRIPPPKPKRYYLHHSETNLSKIQGNSDFETFTKIIQPSSRISQTKKKSASYMPRNRKESHILV